MAVLAYFLLTTSAVAFGSSDLVTNKYESGNYWRIILLMRRRFCESGNED